MDNTHQTALGHFTTKKGKWKLVAKGEIAAIIVGVLSLFQRGEIPV